MKTRHVSRKAEIELRKNRCGHVNQMLLEISSCGRRFFYHEGHTSLFEVDDFGKIWFVDSYSRQRIFMHRPEMARLRGFTQGGTLQALIRAAKRYIMTGRRIDSFRFGPWPDYYCNGDLWGYGESMRALRDRLKRLPCIQTKDWKETR
jgi:hypothetical protein